MFYGRFCCHICRRDIILGVLFHESPRINSSSVGGHSSFGPANLFVSEILVRFELGLQEFLDLFECFELNCDISYLHKMLIYRVISDRTYCQRDMIGAVAAQNFGGVMKKFGTFQVNR